MKKLLTFIIFFAILFFVFQFIVSLVINSHTVSYKLYQGKKEFEINEIFEKTNKKHDYFFEITVDSYHFAFHNQSNFNKRKKIIENIEYYEETGWMCIFPIFSSKKNISTNEIICQKDGKTYTYSFLKQQGETVVDSFVNELQKKEYTHISWDQVNEEKKVSNFSYYPQNLLDDSTIVLWDYRGVYLLQKNNYHDFNLLSSDRYENTHGVLIGDYYMFPNYDQLYDFNSWYMIDLSDEKKDFMVMEEKISFDSYINGVVDNNLYLVDRSNKKQFKIDPENKKTKLIASEEEDGQYYDGNWKSKTIYELVNNDLIFSDFNKNKLNKKLEDSYNITDRFQVGNKYYFKTNDGSVYVSYKDHPNYVILLFQLEDIVDFQVIGDTIYVISNDMIYQYDFYTGLKPVVKNNELKYNYNNIFEVYKK